LRPFTTRADATGNWTIGMGAKTGVRVVPKPPEVVVHDVERRPPVLTFRMRMNIFRI
jgi:hypothetical protein